MGLFRIFEDGCVNECIAQNHGSHPRTRFGELGKLLSQEASQGGAKQVDFLDVQMI